MAVRHSGLSLSADGISYLQAGDWLGSVSYRWLNSDHHFRGDHDEGDVRYGRGNEVINNTHTIEFTVSYAITQRYSVSLNLPVVYNTRSSLYEHDGRNRYTTGASGLGDLRLVANAWLFNPETHDRGNIGVGLGVKAPTGDSDAMDTFYTRTGPQIRPVDQSIQPGDGGWGVTFELQAFQRLFTNAYAYLNGSYLMNPREVNGTPTYRSAPNEAVMSVPDQYFGTAGFAYVIWPEASMFLTLGARIEGVTVYDLVGGSEGFRRPGIAVSVEPGIGFAAGKFTFNITTPVAVYRNRFQSVPDKQRGTHGDAAFADWFITASVSRAF